MTRENMYRDLYNYTAAWLRLDLDEVGGCLASGRDGGEADAYTEAFGIFSDVFRHILCLEEDLNLLFRKLDDLPGTDLAARAEAEAEISRRLEILRGRTQTLERGQIP